MKFAIGSRGSRLALWQANWVRDQLVAAGYEVEIKVIKTTGDKLANVSLTRSGTKGLFIKEIEESLAAGSVDLAVHSLKDLPTEQPSGLEVGAVPRRADCRDVLISRNGRRLEDLPSRSRVGTSSLRRQSQLRALRPDLETVSVRGNVDTRIKKLERDDYDAVVLAAAGLERLGLSARVTQHFTIEEMCPAVGQGALAVEVRQGDERIRAVLRLLDDGPTHQAVRAERTLLRSLGGGCNVPIAAHALADAARLCLVAVIASLDGSRVIRTRAEGSLDDPDKLGLRAAEDLFRQGARSILSCYSDEVSQVE